MELAAILISPRGVSGALRDVSERLRGLGVELTIVDEVGTAVDVWRRHRRPPAILLDLRDVGAGEVEDQRVADDAIRRVTTRLPSALPIVVTNDADAMLIVSCLRAGAGDVLDLLLEGTASARAAVQRICERQAARSAEIAMVASQRDMIEDLLKELIRTERRSIDAEEALAARTRSSDGAPGRSPGVLLVEHERAVADVLAELLEAAGVATFAYVTGEEALREAEALAAGSGLDLALVATRLPGIDGFETVRRLRARIPDLQAFLITSPHDDDLAVSAADLEVVGFVRKPLGDIDEVVERLAQLARESLHRSREHVYLQRIKERHERILARYRSLPREP